MPPHPPIDPQGIYHVGSRGTYGRALFRNDDQHELFLSLYERSAEKYGWQTLAWVLMKNHHHFVIQLTDDGLSAGMQEIHSGYSRRIHAIYGQTRKGHLVRHRFFRRELSTDGAVVAACLYVDLNPLVRRSTPRLDRRDWSGLAATLGRVQPRPFHAPHRLLSLLGRDAPTARRRYLELLTESHERNREATSNEGVIPVTAP